MHVTCCQNISNRRLVWVSGTFPLPHTFAQFFNRNRGIQYVRSKITFDFLCFDVANIQTVFHKCKFIFILHGVTFRYPLRRVSIHRVSRFVTPFFNNGIPHSFAPVKILLCTRIRDIVCRTESSRIVVGQSFPTGLFRVPTIR